MSLIETKILVRVQPSAPWSEVVGFAEGVLQVKVVASPVQGKANKELVALLSEALGIGKSMVTIVKGQTSRTKVIAVAGLSREEVMGRLLPSSSGDAKG